MYFKFKKRNLISFLKYCPCLQNDVFNKNLCLAVNKIVIDFYIKCTSYLFNRVFSVGSLSHIIQIFRIAY